LTVKPSPAPLPVSDAGPLPGYSGDSCALTNSTSSRAWKMSFVPLPWWTSQSKTMTRDSPCASSACCAAIATWLSRQKPIARADSAWWPGGRCSDAATGASAPSTTSTARTAPPAPCSAAVHEPGEVIVSASIAPPPASTSRSMASQ
jgi:hypothetical protein